MTGVASQLLCKKTFMPPTYYRVKNYDGRCKRHLANLYPKMGVASRGEAVRKALFENWITIRDFTHEEEEEHKENPDRE